MSVASAFASYEAHYASLIASDTWGHLAPKVGEHKGSMWIALTERESNSPEILKTDFPTLEASPWEYNALCDIAFEMSKQCDFEEGKLYKITGKIAWGDIIPENFDLKEYREDEDDPEAVPTFDQGMLDWEFTEEIAFEY